MTDPTIWDLALLGVFLIAAFWIRHGLQNYLAEKGKNLATKEDVGAITSEVEKIRSDYKKQEHLYQIMTAGLLTKRAEVIEKLYKMIVETEEAFQMFVDFAEWPDHPKDELRKKAGAMLYDFVRDYKRNRIYFSNDVCEKLHGFEKLIYQKSMPYSIALTAKLEGERLKDFTETWVKASEAFQTEIPRARQAIEAEFRSLLGVE
jgi:hypothetical protein